MAQFDDGLFSLTIRHPFRPTPKYPEVGCRSLRSVVMSRQSVPGSAPRLLVSVADRIQ